MLVMLPDLNKASKYVSKNMFAQQTLHRVNFHGGKATWNSRSREYVFRNIPAGILGNFAPFCIKFVIYYNVEFW